MALSIQKPPRHPCRRWYWRTQASKLRSLNSRVVQHDTPVLTHWFIFSSSFCLQWILKGVLLLCKSSSPWLWSGRVESKYACIAVQPPCPCTRRWHTEREMSVLVLTVWRFHALKWFPDTSACASTCSRVCVCVFFQGKLCAVPTARQKAETFWLIDQISAAMSESFSALWRASGPFWGQGKKLQTPSAQPKLSVDVWIRLLIQHATGNAFLLTAVVKSGSSSYRNCLGLCCLASANVVWSFFPVKSIKSGRKSIG